MKNVDFTPIPEHIEGESITPLRKESANTTAGLRRVDFST